MKSILKNKRLLFLLSILLLVIYSYFTTKTARMTGYSKESSGLSLLASEVQQDTFQIYSAKTWGMKGLVAHHTWVSYIRRGEEQYTVAHVVGWRKYRNKSVLVIKKDMPDRRWYGNKPILIDELKGNEATEAINKVEEIVRSYPYNFKYTLWPGPNSNSFTAHIIRSIDSLKVELPVQAIGKDYIVGSNQYFAKSQTGTGYQFSLKGLFGITVGLRDGIEFNILGLCFGVDFYRPAIKLPIFGRIGFKDK